MVLKHVLRHETSRISEIQTALQSTDAQARLLVRDLVGAGMLETCGATGSDGRPAKLYRLADSGMEVAMLVSEKEDWLEGKNPRFLDNMQEI